MNSQALLLRFPPHPCSHHFPVPTAINLLLPSVTDGNKSIRKAKDGNINVPRLLEEVTAGGGSGFEYPSSIIYVLKTDSTGRAHLCAFLIYPPGYGLVGACDPIYPLWYGGSGGERRRKQESLRQKRVQSTQMAATMTLISCFRLHFPLQ